MNTSIKLKGVSVTYDVHLDKTTSFKEYFVNLVRRSGPQRSHFKEVKALRGLSFEISQGERVGIIGKNGAGKSTLLKLMAGLIKPTAGEIQVAGAVQPLIEISAGFNPEFSGRENIYFNGAMLGFSKREIKTFEKDVIEFSELGDAIDMPTKCYSSGMGARLAFSIATNIKPEILLLDEMLGAGDFSFVEKARNRMDALIDTAKILVLVSHNLPLVQDLCPRTIVLKKGEVIFDGDTERAMEAYKKNG